MHLSTSKRGSVRWLVGLGWLVGRSLTQSFDVSRSAHVAYVGQLVLVCKELVIGERVKKISTYQCIKLEPTIKPKWLNCAV